MDSLPPYFPHLRNMAEIMAVFKKSRSAILAWFRAGAPIVLDGAYSCDYFELQKWRVKVHAV